MRYIGHILLTLSLVVSVVAETKSLGNSADKAQLNNYLKAHWLSPEDYVVSKFSDHDIVFLGEYHRIRHDAELVQALIPRLYRAGIRNLGFEFGDFDDQQELDGLLNASTYDEALARKLLFRSNCGWGYKEYLDIYRTAWKLNQSLPPGAPRFRVVNLMYRPDWTALQDTRSAEVMKKVWYKGDGDAYMAHVVFTEFVAKNQKALIYCGMHHAFTRYKQPIYDFEKGHLDGLSDSRMGNLVYKKIGSRAMTVYLHAAWVSSRGWNAPQVRPANGTIDEVMAGLRNTRVGFDVVGTPFGNLSATDTYYALGYPSFKLSDFADGYIYQKPFRDYRGVTVDPQFITMENLKEAIATLPNPEARESLTSPEKFLEAMKDSANMQQRFRELW